MLKLTCEEQHDTAYIARTVTNLTLRYLLTDVLVSTNSRVCLLVYCNYPKREKTGPER